jgi:hypothetical protein
MVWSGLAGVSSNPAGPILSGAAQRHDLEIAGFHDRHQMFRPLRQRRALLGAIAGLRVTSSRASDAKIQVGVDCTGARAIGVHSLGWLKGRSGVCTTGRPAYFINCTTCAVDSSPVTTART